MIKQSLLNELVGMPVEDARKKASKKGLKLRVTKDGVATIMLAFPHTINAWEKDGLITSATAGDGLELMKDTEEKS